MTSKKIISCILAASLLTGAIPVSMGASAADTPATVTITPGTDEAMTGTGRMTITLKIKQDISPSVTLEDWQYKGTPSTPVVEGNTGNGKVTYLYKAKDADDSTYSDTVPTAAGQYTVKAVIAETDEYKGGSDTADFEIKPYSTGLTITLKIKQSITPTVTLADWQYKGTPNTPEVTGNTGNGAVTYLYKAKDADDSTYSDTVPTAAGQYTVKAVIAETDEYKAGSATADFEIKPYSTGLVITLKIKQSIEPTVSLTGWTYGSAANTPSVTGNTGNGDVTYLYKAKDADDSTYSDTVPTAAGEYTVKAVIAETNEYKAGEATANFTIAKIPFTLTGASLTYNGDAQNLISGYVPAGTKFTLTAPKAGLDYTAESTKILPMSEALIAKAYSGGLSSEEFDYYSSAGDALGNYYNAITVLSAGNESEAADFMLKAQAKVNSMEQYSITPPDEFKEAIDYINTYIKGKTLDDVKARFETVEPNDWSNTITATNAGTYTVYYKGSGNYDDTVKSVTATINQAVPAVLIPANLPAEYGQTLADVELPTDENGTWAWDDALTTSVGDVGNKTFSATFTPYDTDNYSTYTTDLTVNVKAISATPTAVGTLNATYGDTLADVALPTPEDGTWAWKDAGTTSVGNAGEQTFKAVFTPSSPNYTAVEQTLTVNVAKADPTPDAVTGLTIAYGKKLSDVTLPTGWTWDDDTLSVGNVGDNAFAATYTPADTDNYNVLNQNLTVNVVAVDKAALNEAVTAANTYLATIQKTVYADPALALSFAITDAKGVAENDNVTEEQVAQAITDVNNAVTTAKDAVKDIDDTLAAQAVTDQINALPAAADIVSADKTAVDAAREAYTNLTEAQKAKVTTETTDKLTAAEKAVADRIAADAVIAKIDEIGTVALTDESKALIDAARAAYDALATENQKALVSNYSTLIADEQKYYQMQIEDVEAKINAIGKVELTDEVKANINTARTAYDALTAEQKALVRNAVALGYAETLYDTLSKLTDAQTAQKAAEDAQKAAEDAQKAAEKTAQEATDKAAAAEAAQKAAEDALAKGEADAAEKVAAAEAAQKAAEEAQAKAEADKLAAETAKAEAEAAQKAAEDALAKAESDAAAKIATAQAAQKAAEDAQKAAEKTAQEATDKAAAAETAQKAAEDALAKGEADAAEKVAAAEAAQKAAEEAQAKAEADKLAAETAKADAEAAQKAAEDALAEAEKQAAIAKTAADKDAAAKVVALINAIGKVKKTNDCENKIVSARAAYEALTDDQKAYVTNFATLVKAESDYNTLPQTGMSGFHKVLAGMAALMGITGMGLVKKSRKEDEE